MSSVEMYIYEYSEKSIAVFGNTTPHKEILEEYGGKYNRNLKKDGENTPGWIFIKSKREKIQKYINSNTFGTNTIAPIMVQSTTISTPRLLSSTATSSINTTSIIERLEVIERILNITGVQINTDILQRLDAIEKIVLVQKPVKKEKVIQIENYEDDVEEVECIKPMRRLLSKK